MSETMEQQTAEGTVNLTADDNADNDAPGDEKIIEIDFGMLAGAKAKRVKALHITERFLKTDLVPKLTARELKKIFIELQQLEATMETMHVDLGTTQITGAMLASAITKKLTALHVKGGLFLANQDDRIVLGKAIYEHEFLGEIKLHNLVAKNRLIARWNKHPAPPLDILVPAITSIVFLNVLELSCSRSEEFSTAAATAPTADANLTAAETTAPRPMLSFVAVKELSHLLTLQRLELSRLNLTDGHFGVLVEQLSQNSSTSCLKQLVLNENRNTDSGLAMMASLLFKEDCALELLECYQTEAVVEGSTVELFEDALKTNTTLHSLRIHMWGDEDTFGGDVPRRSTQRGRIPFFLELNGKGRKRLIQQQTTPSQWLDLITDVKDDPAVLFYCLRNSRYWWTCRGLCKARPDDFIVHIPASPELVSPLGKLSEERKKRSSSRLEELKGRHSQVLAGLNVEFDLNKDDLSDIEENEGQVEGSSTSESKNLEVTNLPRFLNLSMNQTHHDDTRNSIISSGANSYIQDLLNQKEDRPQQAREEVLEEALEELDYAKTNDKIPPGMSDAYYFNSVLTRLTKEKEKEELERERKLDKLLESTLIEEAGKEMSARETAVNPEDTAPISNGGDHEAEKSEETDLATNGNGGEG